MSRSNADTAGGPHRGKLLAKVHVQAKHLGLDEGAYRDTLEANYGVRSARDLNNAQLTELARAFGRQLKQSGRPAKRGNTYPGRPRNMDKGSGRAAQLEKIEALLTEAGRPWSYADTLAQRICKVDRIGWVPDHDLYKIITALVKDAKRHGRRTK